MVDHPPGPKRVLVCDDERHILRLVQVNLERQGHEVRTARSGDEAIALMEREAVDLILLDPTLPGPNVEAWMRENGSTRMIPVIRMARAKE